MSDERCLKCGSRVPGHAVNGYECKERQLTALRDENERLREAMEVGLEWRKLSVKSHSYEQMTASCKKGREFEDSARAALAATPPEETGGVG